MNRILLVEDHAAMRELVVRELERDKVRPAAGARCACWQVAWWCWAGWGVGGQQRAPASSAAQQLLRPSLPMARFLLQTLPYALPCCTRPI